MNTKKLLIFTGIIIVIVAIAGAESLIASHLIASDNTSQNCRGNHTGHTILLNGKNATPRTVIAPLCDTVTFKNTDSTTVLIAFGPHEHHVAYDGILEHELKQDESFTITLNKTGTFYFHDHLEDIIEGQFTVTN